MWAAILEGFAWFCFESVAFLFVHHYQSRQPSSTSMVLMRLMTLMTASQWSGPRELKPCSRFPKRMSSRLVLDLPSNAVHVAFRFCTTRILRFLEPFWQWSGCSTAPPSHLCIYFFTALHTFYLYNFFSVNITLCDASLQMLEVGPRKHWNVCRMTISLQMLESIDCRRTSIAFEKLRHYSRTCAKLQPHFSEYLGTRLQRLANMWIWWNLYIANARQKTSNCCNSAKPSTTSFPAQGHTTWEQSLRDPSPSRQRISKSKRQPDMIGACAVSGWMRHLGSSAFSFLTLDIS